MIKTGNYTHYLDFLFKVIDYENNRTGTDIETPREYDLIPASTVGRLAGNNFF